MICACIPRREFPRLVAQGRITDAATLAAYGLLLMREDAAFGL